MAVAPEAPPERPEFVGVITARQTKVITADFEGRIDRLSIKTGQRVRAGDVIGKLDDSDLRLQLERAKASERALRGEVAAAGARASALSRQAKSERILARAGAAPIASVRNALADASAAGATTSAASGRLGEAAVGREQIEALLAKAELRAPIDGVITMVRAKEGEVAQKGTTIARVFDPSDLLVRFAVPHELRAAIRPGKRLEIQVEGLDHTITATVQQIGDEVEPPINFTVVEADIDDSKLSFDEVRVTASARVRIADATTGAAR